MLLEACGIVALSAWRCIPDTRPTTCQPSSAFVSTGAPHAEDGP